MQCGQDGRESRGDLGGRIPPLKAPKGGVSADDITSFTLGSVTVSPLSMAAAYATMAARGKSAPRWR